MHTAAHPAVPARSPGCPDLPSLCTPAPVRGAAGAAVEAAATQLARTTPFVHRQLRVALHAAVAQGVPLAEATDAVEQFGPYHLVDAATRLPGPSTATSPTSPTSPWPG